MTNREWLSRLSNKELEEWLCDEMYDDEYEHDCMFDEPRTGNTRAVTLEEVKHGKWLYNYYEEGLFPQFYNCSDFVVCSICNERAPSFLNANYCPNCGADMRGEIE